MTDRQDLARTLFPPVPRDFPFRRGLRNILRTVHILTGGVLLGGHVFGQPAAALEPWLWWSVLSGLALLATDLHASFAVLFELRGAAVLVKALCVSLVPWWWEQRVALLTIALVVGALVSHLPGRVRHTAWVFPGRFAADRRRG